LQVGSEQGQYQVLVTVFVQASHPVDYLRQTSHLLPFHPGEEHESVDSGAGHGRDESVRVLVRRQDHRAAPQDLTPVEVQVQKGQTTPHRREGQRQSVARPGGGGAVRPVLGQGAQQLLQRTHQHLNQELFGAGACGHQVSR
jgi:hypothetical protein